MRQRAFITGIALTCALPALAQGNPTGTVSGQSRRFEYDELIEKLPLFSRVSVGVRF